MSVGAPHQVNDWAQGEQTFGADQVTVRMTSRQTRLSVPLLRRFGCRRVHGLSRLIWNRAASSYADVLDGQFTQAIDPILDAAGVAGDTRLLDVGMGPGSIVAAARSRGAHATGIDYAEAMVSTARTLHPRVAFEVADAADLPFASNSFDAVVMGFTLFLIPEPERAPQESYRVLANGGTLAFTVWDGATPGHCAFGSALAKHTGQSNPFGDLPLLGVNDQNVLKGIVRSAGFASVHAQSLPIVWQIETATQIFDAFAPMYDLTGLSPRQLEAFRSGIVSNASPFRTRHGYAVPFPALLVSARKAKAHQRIA